jgi:hypothetical protein
MTVGRVAIVLAAIEPGPTHSASLAGFLREVEGRGDVVVVGGGRSDSRLVPELWRDGLKKSDADHVAFSTTQMIPVVGWLDAMLARLVESGIWGVGGSIAAGHRLGPLDRSIYLQRFLSYGPGMPLPIRPSGENAIYRRDRLVEVADAWSEGFWESEVHRRLEGMGGGWAVAPDAIVTYGGGMRLSSATRQRVLHARRFGSIRSKGWGRSRRWLRALATPLVPAVLLGRARRGLASRRMPVGPWLHALPSFLLLAGAWATGETIGACSGRPGFADRSMKD